MRKVKRTIFAAILAAGSVGAANGQSLPRLDTETARNLFAIYAGCRAYWKVMAQCLPQSLSGSDRAQVQKSLDQLQSVGGEQMKWLASKAQLSRGMQQQIADTATRRVTTAAGGSCSNTPSLIQEHRDKCAALFQNIAEAQKEIPPANRPTADEIAASSAKFILSTCYDSIDDISRVSSYARMMKWNPLSADQKNVAKPANATSYEAWEVDHEGFTYIVSVNRGQFKGRPSEVCQIAVNQRPDSIVSRITATVKTRTVGTTNAGLQMTDIFELVSHPTVKSAAMIVGRADDKEFFTIAFMGIK